jgi:hypothetical protein
MCNKLPDQEAACDKSGAIMRKCDGGAVQAGDLEFYVE